MSNVGLFAIGSLVTLLVAGSMALLVWAAILDGRYQNERQAAEQDAPGPDYVGVAGSGRVVSKPSHTPRTTEVLAPTSAAGFALADHAGVLTDQAAHPLPAVAHATSEAAADQRVWSGD